MCEVVLIFSTFCHFIFSTITAKPRTPLCSFDLNCSDSMIAAGGELLEEEEDAYLFFWYE